MKIFCVGRNYVAHAKELHNEVPTQPVVFMKPKNALLRPGEYFYYPSFTRELHYECELVLQMAENGKHIQTKYASRYYDKIGLGIDFTARDIQNQLKKAGHPWEIAKAFDQSAVMGKLISISRIEDPLDIHFHLLKNGSVVQNGHAANMIFSFDEIIAYLSRYFTLNIGDLIYTGTPAGVGPVKIGDYLEGFLEGEKMFEVEIK